MIDCFGTEISADEIRRWNELGYGKGLCAFGWNVDGMPPVEPLVVDLPDGYIPIKMPVSEGDLIRMYVLEIGCGMGNHAVALNGHVNSYVGIDISTLGVAIARYRCSRFRHTSFFHSAYDILRIRLLRTKIDAVFGIEFFYHQPPDRLRGMAAFAYDVLCSGGILKMDLLGHVGGRPGLLANEDGVAMGEKWHGFDHDFDGVERMLLDLGFSHVEFDRHTYPESWSRIKDDLRTNVIAKKP